MLYKNDGNSIGIKSSLWIQALSSDGLKVIDNPTKLLDNTEVVNPKNIKVSKHPTTIEGPVIVKAPDGKYVLFFAGNNYATSDYFTGYAISDKLKGPYKYIGPLITTLSSSKTGEEIVGPGIGDLMEVSPNKYYISLNGWVNGIGKKQEGIENYFIDMSVLKTDIHLRFLTSFTKINLLIKDRKRTNEIQHKKL
ncbi:family 43 glycosylhydrolase [Lactococcus garvieae]